MLLQALFNIENGYLEGLLRGFKYGILRQNDYLNLVQCDSLDDLKIHLQSTDYGNFLANEASPLTVSVIEDKLREKLVSEFHHVRNQSVEPLSTFLDFITYSYMIDNIILLIIGTLYQRPILELIVIRLGYLIKWKQLTLQQLQQICIMQFLLIHHWHHTLLIVFLNKIWMK